VDTIAHDKPMTELAHVLEEDSLYPHPERLVPFAGNHDTVRFVTQAGGSVPKLKLALGLVTTLRGMPLIYSGDEIAMAGGADPDNRHDFPGGFAGDRQDAFTQAGRTAVQQEVFAWTSGLLKLREAHAAFKTGIEQNLFADDDAFAFVRATDAEGCVDDSQGERFLIVVNKSAKSKSVDLETADSALAGCTSFHPVTSSGTDLTARDGKLHVEEPAESMTVFAVR
jgi:neopullulanase